MEVRVEIRAFIYKFQLPKYLKLKSILRPLQLLNAPQIVYCIGNKTQGIIQKKSNSAKMIQHLDLCSDFTCYFRNLDSPTVVHPNYAKYSCVSQSVTAMVLLNGRSLSQTVWCRIGWRELMSKERKKANVLTTWTGGVKKVYKVFSVALFKKLISA